MLVSGTQDMSRAQLLEQLEVLLSESREAAVRREKSAFDEAAHPFGERLVLFGAGGLGRKTLEGLRQVGIEPLAFSDNDAKLWGREVDGLTVLSPTDAAAKYGTSAAFLLTIWRAQGTDRMRERIARVRSFGVERVIPFAPLFWKYPDAFLPHYLMELPHRVIDQAGDVRAAAALWDDGASRNEFLAQVRWRLRLDFDGLPDPVKHELYFPDDLFRFSAEENFVDCGAYDGDTIRSSLKRQPEFRGHIAAFEPDPSNFRRLQAYVASLPEAIGSRIETYPYAVSSSRKIVHFDATGGADAAVGTGDLEIEAVALDEVLAGQSPTYLKMDTEGSEPAGVTGAKNIIQRHAPALALSIYHRQNHIWSVPNLVKELNPDYRFFLRPHVLEGWDTVCYAVPPARLRA